MLEEPKESDDLDLPFDLRTLLLRVRQRWKSLLLGSVLATLSGVLLAVTFGERVYEAEAVLHYRPSEVEQNPPNLLTLLNMVKLQENLEEVRDKLELQTSLSSLSSAYKVDVRRDTELLVIQARSGSPEKASELALALREVFLESQESKRRNKLTAALSSLEKRLEEVTAELKRADNALQEFTVKNQIVDLDKEAQWYLEELTSLQLMLEEAQVQRTSVREKAENIDSIVGDLKAKVAREKAESQTEFDSLGDINIRVQRLRAAIHDDKTQRSGEALLEQKRLELERAEGLRAKGLLSDSEYEKKLAAYSSQQALTVDTDQVAEWKAQVDELNSKAIPNTGQSSQSGPILQEMMLKSFDIQLDLVTQDKRVASVQEAVKKARARLDALPQLQRQFAALSRDVKAIESQKTDLEARVGDTRRLLSTRLQDFVPASEPKIRPEPVSSNRRLLAVAVTVIGVLMVVVGISAREFLDPKSVSAAELAARTGLKVFGELPEEALELPGKEENLLARSLPQAGTFVFTSPQEGVELEGACLRIARALTFQGVSTIVVGLNGACPGSELGEYLAGRLDAPMPLRLDGGELALYRGAGELAPSYFRSTRFCELLEFLRSRTDFVLILAPDLESSVSADILAEQSGGVVIVTDTQTDLSVLKKSSRRILNRTLGLVLTGTQAPFRGLD